MGAGEVSDGGAQGEERGRGSRGAGPFRRVRGGGRGEVGDDGAELDSRAER